MANQPLQVIKTVSALPVPLVPNAVYLVRVGQGYDLYATDITGSSAYKINVSPSQLTEVIAIANGGTGATDVTAARNNLGLGTAATYTAGTSANNVLLLNNRGYIPQSALNGIYKNTVLDVTNGGIYRATSTSATVYGLGDIRLSNNVTGVIVIKTTIPFSKGVVVSLNIEGLTDSETSTIKMNILGYTAGNITKFSTGTKDIPVRKAQSSDGFLCFILGETNIIIGVSTALSIISAHVNYFIDPTHLTGWSLSTTNDLSSYTNISAFATQKQSFIEASVYTKLADSSFDGSVKSLRSGSASYKKGWRKLTATLPSQAGEVTVAHGVTTVETVQAKVTNSDGIIIYNNDIDQANQFYVRVNGANLVLGVTANSTKVFGGTVTIYVGEEL